MPEETIKVQNRTLKVEITLENECIRKRILLKIRNTETTCRKQISRAVPWRSFVYPEFPVLKCLQGKSSLSKLFSGNAQQKPPSSTFLVLIMLFRLKV